MSSGTIGSRAVKLMAAWLIASQRQPKAISSTNSNATSTTTNSTSTTTPTLEELQKLDMLEALEIQQDSLQAQFDCTIQESQRTDISKKRRTDLIVKASSIKVRILKINQKIMKLREELEDV